MTRQEKREAWQDMQTNQPEIAEFVLLLKSEFGEIELLGYRTANGGGDERRK